MYMGLCNKHFIWASVAIGLVLSILYVVLGVTDTIPIMDAGGSPTVPGGVIYILVSLVLFLGLLFGGIKYAPECESFKNSKKKKKL